MGLLDWLFRRRQVRPAAPTPTIASAGFVVIDVETTGLVPARDRIVEIAIVRTDGSGSILDEWHTLLNPGGPVGASHIHGISAIDVLHAPRFQEAIGEVNARLSGRVLVAHNAPFDLGFLAAEYARAGAPLPRAPQLCTLQASSIYLPRLARRRLADCCWACDIPLHEAHTALADARATAHLLATYLSPRGVPPRRAHTTLPKLARRVRWPTVPVQPVSPVHRPTHAAAAVAAPPGTLWRLLDDLPLATVIDEGAPATSQPYLELLLQALEDGVLSTDEAGSLAELARAYSLSRDQVQATHRAFLVALAHRIVEDGKVTREERRELTEACDTLGFTDELPRQILDEAKAARHASLAESGRPLPASSSLGAPLHIGDAIAFTGCNPLLRARLEGRALAAGLRVTGSVSRRTAALVADGASPNTAKSVAARQHRTRVVTPEAFAILVKHVQPAPAPTLAAPDDVRPVPAPRSAGAAQSSPRRAAPRSDEDPLAPATVRAWARQQGLEVGVRGRIPAHVLAAYRAHRS